METKNHTIRVKVLAPFTVKSENGNGVVEIPEGSNIHKLIRILQPRPVILRLLPVAVNGEQVKRSYTLKENDTVIFVSPYSGG